MKQTTKENHIFANINRKKEGADMTTLELKALFQKEIENEQNKSVIERVQAYYHRLKISPCRFSEEELNQEVSRSVEDANRGGGKSLEEMRNKHPRQ